MNLNRSLGVGGTGYDADGEARALQPGTLIAGRYQVKGMLGAGGMGAVYRVRDKLRDTDVALKVMLPSLLSKTKAVERFNREANIMLRLTHEGIVRVYGVGLDQPRGLRFLPWKC
ncbi:MAG: protein kinase domain-containing protein [Planctomycetota bacterium]|jgi:serine/threonine protein kinase